MYPFIEKQKVWENDIQFWMSSYRSESWYGIKGWLEKCDNDIEKAIDMIHNWNRSLRNLLSAGDIVIDAGANEGYTTVVMAKKVGPQGRVIAIDADPSNIELIKKNVALNKLNNVEIIHAAIAEKSGDKVRFLNEVVQEEAEGILVRTLCLDDLAERHPTVIKMDIEGYELPGLKGSRKLLAQGVKIELEIHLSQTTGINMIDRFGFNPKEIFDLLKSYGYTLTYNGKEITNAVFPPGGCIYCTREVPA